MADPVAAPDSTRVAVCVATYRRPILLSTLLESLTQLTFPKSGSPEVHLIVVDNDHAGSAREIVASGSAGFQGPVHYAIEPRRNIAAARNTALELALSQGAEWIAFVDDDERVAPTWLDELLDAQRSYVADVVCGPVFPYFEEDADAWVVSGAFFDPHRFETGSTLDFGLTGSALLASSLVENGLRFDERFGLGGAEDVHFFTRLYRAGATIVWTNDARAEELIPASRANARWILRRAFRVGNSQTHCVRAIATRPSELVLPLAQAFIRMGVGLVRMGPALFSGRISMLRSLRMICHGAGAIAAVGGLRYKEYRKVHGG